MKSEQKSPQVGLLTTPLSLEDRYGPALILLLVSQHSHVALDNIAISPLTAWYSNPTDYCFSPVDEPTDRPFNGRTPVLFANTECTVQQACQKALHQRRRSTFKADAKAARKTSNLRTRHVYNHNNQHLKSILFHKHMYIITQSATYNHPLHM